MTHRRLSVVDLCSGTGSSTRPFADAGHSVALFDLFPPRGAPAVTNVVDVREIAAAPEKFFGKRAIDHLHAGPPCQGFAVPSIGRMWHIEGRPGAPDTVYTPKHDTARLGIDLMDACVEVIAWLRDRAAEDGRPFTWTLENPRAMMRRVMPVRHPWMGEPAEVSYCRYGPLGPVPVIEGPPMVWAQKATDIWTNLDGREGGHGTWEPLKCWARPPKAPRVWVERDGWRMEFVERDGEPCHEAASRGTKCGIQRIKGADARGMMPRGLTDAIRAAVERVHGLAQG